jgi:protein involved in plasmid replication-relaxation
MTATKTKTVKRSPYGRGRILTERQRKLPWFAFRHRVVSRDQVKAWGEFGSLTRVNTCLAASVDADLLSRKAIPVYPGKGSAQALYYIGKGSGTLLDVAPEIVTKLRRRISRWGWPQVEHVLASNQVLVDFVVALRHVPDAALLSYNTEPELRQIFLNHRLVPDGWMAWTAEGKRFNCFIEVDLHKEGLIEWRKKILEYLEYAESGQHQELFGFRAFRVLVLAKSQPRLENLRRLAVPGGQLFRFTKLAAVNSDNIMAKVWLPASGSIPLALTEA